ncbi:PAS domain S-box protein [Micromonospora sp. NPDC049679]|uniref:PAS domain S-box protein n=1 Tax=Micromonospora sp. NPDC049679 TaxID=3155920 RepID=UPI0033FC4971
MALVVLFIVAGATSSAYQHAEADGEARRAAVGDAVFGARLAARDISEALAALQKVIVETGANPAIEQAFAPGVDPSGCSLSFTGIGAFKTGHLDIVRSDGRVICSSLKNNAGYRGASWLARARSGPGVIGPVVDDRTGKQVMIGSTPIKRLGMVAAFLDLDALGPALAATYGGPRSLSILVTSGDGATAVTRSIAPQRWTGAPLHGTPFAADAGRVERRDPDGVPRLYGTATVPDVGWQVHAGADRDAAVAAARRLSERQSAITLAGLLVILVAAAVFYRRILRPVRQLSAAVRTATGGGAGPRPVPVAGPAELADLAEDFNRMIATTELHLADVSRLAAIVQSSGDAIVGKTLDGIITSWNDGAAAIYGYRADEVIGRHISMLVPADRHHELDGLLHRVSQGERVERQETQRIRRDGTLVEVSVTISPIRDGAGRVVGASAVAADITEEKRAAAERASLEQRLQQSQRLESLGQLAGGVAHDFNNLLAVILSCAELLTEELDEGSAGANDLRAIQRAAERAVRLTRQLLIFGRQETTHPEVLDLNLVIADLQDLLARSIGEHVHLVVEPEPRLPAVKADRGQLEQVLVNLAVNARDAMPDGGRLTIETTTVEVDEAHSQTHPQITPGRYVQLCVSDTGTGMSADVAARVFEPFFTTKAKGTGTGLGLATVYGIVTEAGGTVGVYSEPGLGTTFRVYLPQVDDEAVVPAPHTPVPIEKGHGETVLLVEDEEALREVTGRMLRRNGYEVIEAGHGLEALDVAARTDWDLLLTDVVMPHMSGRELAERLRAQRADLRVLFMSGYSQGVLGPRQALEDGVTLIEKPFTEATLLSKISAALTGHRGDAETVAPPRPPAAVVD